MSKRPITQKNQSSLLSLGVKRIRCGGDGGENLSSEGQHEPATSNEEPTDEGGGHNHPDEEDADTLDEILECSSDCCKADHEGPNQPKSTQVLAATKRVQSRQARYVQAV